MQWILILTAVDTQALLLHPLEKFMPLMIRKNKFRPDVKVTAQGMQSQPQIGPLQLYKDSL